MAERMKERLLLGKGSGSEAIADVVAGPDTYRDLPMLLETALSDGGSAVNVELSRYETYADVPPVRRKGDCSGVMTLRVVQMSGVLVEYYVVFINFLCFNYGG